jgi:hypothetical protein
MSLIFADQNVFYVFLSIKDHPIPNHALNLDHRSHASLTISQIQKMEATTANFCSGAVAGVQ